MELSKEQSACSEKVEASGAGIPDQHIARTPQEHRKSAAENSQVGCVPIKQSASGAVAVKTAHGHLLYD